MTWLSENDIKEKLSIGYLNLLTAQAGCRLQFTDREADNDGMDVLIWGRKSRNKIDIQLKCTSLDSHSIIEDKGDYYSYKLESKDKYEAGEKYLFIILVLPKDIKTTEIVNFNKIDYDSVIMNAKGYFYEYSTQKQAIRIPKSNLLCKDLLINLIQASEDKSTLIKDL